MKNVGATPLETIERAIQIGKTIGLNHIYRGNCHGRSDTVCPKCGTIAIEREYVAKLNLGPGGKCKNCGHDLNVRV